jgi:hypothetical protein
MEIEALDQSLDDQGNASREVRAIEKVLLFHFRAQGVGVIFRSIGAAVLQCIRRVVDREGFPLKYTLDLYDRCGRALGRARARPQACD